MDWAAEAAYETSSQSEAAWGKETLQLLLNPTSITTTTTITTSATSEYVLS